MHECKCTNSISTLFTLNPGLLHCRASGQVELQGRCAPRPSMDDGELGPDHRHQPEHGQLLEAGPDFLRRAPDRRSRVCQLRHSRGEGRGQTLGGHSACLQQMAWHPRGVQESAEEQEQQRD